MTSRRDISYKVKLMKWMKRKEVSHGEVILVMVLSFMYGLFQGYFLWRALS